MRHHNSSAHVALSQRFDKGRVLSLAKFAFPEPDRFRADQSALLDVLKGVVVWEAPTVYRIADAFIVLWMLCLRGH
jgi:hypothetical protein